MKTLPTFTATIYIGLKDTDSPVGRIFPHSSLKNVCQKYCDQTGFCVSYTETEYIYTRGKEPGAIIGIIHYPRFPSDPKTIKERAITLAKLLQKEVNQYKVTIVTPDETIMIEREDLDGKKENDTDAGFIEREDLQESVESNEENEDEDLGLETCPQCDENAWDGYICHSCGLKNI